MIMNRNVMLQECIKSFHNKKYFVQNYVQLSTCEGVIPCKVNDKLLAMMEYTSSPSDNRLMLVDGARQVGKTTNLLITALHYAIFRGNKTIYMHALKPEYAREYQRKFIELYDRVPHWMKPTAESRTNNSFKLNNGTEIHFGVSSSCIKGKSIHLALFDESALDRVFESTLEALWPCIVAGGKVLITSSRNPGSVFDKLCDHPNYYNIQITKEDCD